DVAPPWRMPPCDLDQPWRRMVAVVEAVVGPVRDRAPVADEMGQQWQRQHAARRPEGMPRAAIETFEQRVGAIDLLELLVQRQPLEPWMVVGMVAQGMAGRDDVLDQHRVPLDLVADQEERRLDTVAREEVKQGQRVLRMRSVVEAQVKRLAPARPGGGDPGARQPAQQVEPPRARRHGGHGGGVHANTMPAYTAA